MVFWLNYKPKSKSVSHVLYNKHAVHYAHVYLLKGKHYHYIDIQYTLPAIPVAFHLRYWPYIGTLISLNAIHCWVLVVI